MPRPVANSSYQVTTLRNLKVLVVLLVVSNIALGIFSVILLRSVDQRYSELIDRAVPALNDLRELMGDTVAVMRATNPRNFSGPRENLPAALRVAHAAMQTAQGFRTGLLGNDSLKEEPADREAVRKTGDAFAATVTEVLQLYSTERLADAVRLREAELLPAFDQHLAAIGKAADAVEALSLGANKDYTTRTNHVSRIVLGVASWPVIALGALLVLTAVFVVAMMIAFRGKDLADTP